MLELVQADKAPASKHLLEGEERVTAEQEKGGGQAQKRPMEQAGQALETQKRAWKVDEQTWGIDSSTRRPANLPARLGRVSSTLRCLVTGMDLAWRPLQLARLASKVYRSFSISFR